MRPAELARLFALSAALIAPRIGRAQDISVGTRVRVSVPELKIDKRRGTLTRVTADSLSVDFGGRPSRLTVAIDRVSSLEIPTGKNRGAGFVYGASLGAIVGLIVGLGVGAMIERGCTPVPGDGGIPCSVVYIATVPGGAAVGLVAGGIIGAAKPPDRWQQVSLRRGASELGMPGVVRPMRFGLSVSF